MQRFFLPPGSLKSDTVVTLDDYAHQLHTVLRLESGDQVRLLDGSGLEYDATLTEVSARRATARVGMSRASAGEPLLFVTLFVSTLKADKFEWVLQKGVELGVSRFVPVVSRRSVVRPASALHGKLPRWRQIVREAAEQSGRGRLPQLESPVDFVQAITFEPASHDLRLLAYEAADPELQRALGGELRASSNSGRGLSLFTGPEGGFDSSEVEAARAAGWLIVSLGRRVLRAETAALAAVAAVAALSGELGSFSP